MRGMFKYLRLRQTSTAYQRCKTCKHYLVEGEQGYCLLANFGGNNFYEPDYPESLAVAGSHESTAWLAVSPYYGCVQWKYKGNE